MFDIGFWELAIISIVALLIVGPEKLPVLVRDAGRWIRAARRFVAQTKREFEREFDFEDEKNLLGSLRNMDNLLENAPDRKHRRQEDPGSTREQPAMPEGYEGDTPADEQPSRDGAEEVPYINPLSADDEHAGEGSPGQAPEDDTTPNDTPRKRSVGEDITG